MLNRLLSHDLPRSRVLAVLLVLLLAALAFAPFIFPGVKALNVAAKVLVFIVLVASFDLLLGYTGIVSFAHTMFFGIGAYGIAVATTRMGATWQALTVGLVASLAISFVLALLIGLFSLRVRAIFFAMITLAVASAFLTLASQLSDITGGEDGLSFKAVTQPRVHKYTIFRCHAGRAFAVLLRTFHHGIGVAAGYAAHCQFAVWPGTASHS
jgi:branched-chain amino acid transport system permease protein